MGTDVTQGKYFAIRASSKQDRLTQKRLRQHRSTLKLTPRKGKIPGISQKKVLILNHNALEDSASNSGKDYNPIQYCDPGRKTTGEKVGEWMVDSEWWMGERVKWIVDGKGG